MSYSSIPGIERTLQTTDVWLNDLLVHLGWTDHALAYHALGVVLHALRDRLPVDHVAKLGTQLPLLVRGVYYEGWHPHGKPLRERRTEEFLAHVQAGFPASAGIDPQRVTRAILQLLERHVSAGAVATVKSTLPGEIRELWEGIEGWVAM